MFFPKYKKQFWIIVVLVSIVILMSGGGLIAYFLHYSATNERVCEKCHGELISLWRKSKGHPAEQTKCFECHSQKHEIVPKEWNVIRHARDQIAPPEYLADDNLTSQRCLECHQDVLNLNYKVKKRVIKFNHRIHNEEGLDCVDCHRAAGHEYMTGGTNRPSVSECLECHLREFEGPPKNQKCLNCHDVMLVPGRTIS